MDAPDELVLLERVFLRIGSAETDEQLETTLSKFLTPVLLKLSSQTDGVRKKVMELLVHVNKRLKSRPKIQLPVPDLIAQYQDPQVSQFVTNFTILYIKMGFPRLDPSKKAELILSLTHCLNGKPQTQQDGLIQLIVPALQYVKYPSDVDKKRALFDLTDRPHITQLLLTSMMDFLLLSYSAGSLSTKTGASTAAVESGSQATKPAVGGIPPGLSENAHKKLLGENSYSPEEIEKIKLGIVEFLGADILPDEQVVSHLVVGTADSRHAVATQADMNLKRIAGSQDWNNPTIISKLYSLFQGTVTIKGQAQSVKPEDKRSPAGVQLRLKIFPYFLKSREAANFFPGSVQVIFDCLYGTNTNTKLKNMAVQFVHHLCFHCTDAKFRPIGAVLLSGMVKLIGETKEDPRLRSLAYVAVGKIAKRVPNLVNKDIALLQTFFDAMCKEESENKLAVQEALSMMSTAFKNIDSSNLRLMEAIIMENIEKNEHQARLMAVQYAVTVFPKDHIPSRYVLLLACGDVKDEVHTEATKALRVIAQSPDDMSNDDAMDISSEKMMPPFVDMVNYIAKKASERIKSSKKYVIGNNILAFNPATYGEILMYLRMCLAHSAGATPNLDTVTSMEEQAPLIAAYVRQLISDQPGDKGPIFVYIDIIKQLLNAIGGPPAMYCLLEIVAVARKKLASQFVKHLDWIKNFMMSSKEDMREYAAQLYALVVVSGETSERQLEIVRELTSNLKSQALEGQHGSMLAVGYLIGGILHKNKDIDVEDMETESTHASKFEETFTLATRTISKHLDNSHILMSGGACTALGEIGRCGALPLPNDNLDDTTTKLSIVSNLIGKVQSTKENGKIREKAAVTLGLLCVGDESFPYRKKIIEGLLECAQGKQFELHFTVGEGLVYAALGPTSPVARDKWTQTEDSFKPLSNGSEEVEELVTLLLGKYVNHGNHHIKQAACIWLLTCVKQCSHHQFIQNNLKSIQSAFMSLLGESDEITQDMASKGLGVVYEKCSKEQKDELVSILVETLTTGKRPKQEVTGETKLFDEGALGKTPDGQNLSTYRELCSIANDLNQPDLIYKFMHLANHNASWNSKKGAAFGFGMIAKQAGEQLAPVLHKIVPKLYRYQFDPNPKIQGAMSSIWTALVTDQKNTVDKYLKEILNDLMQNLTSNQWRVRESSCMAICDLLRGRNLDEVVDKMAELWEILFRVRDDIKESVRKAADVAVKTISRVSIKMCDIQYGKVGEEAISAILPTLLKTGLGSQVEEVRAISLTTIVKISKNAGSLLKPHIPLLVVALLESLSTLEPQMLNYLSLHVAGSAATQEKLDNARLAASKSSPMMDVVKMCVQYVDSPVLAELIPRLTELSRSGVGLGTKAGVANFVISLTHQCPHDLAPYAGKLLAALLNGLHDRNITVKKTYASAIGHLVKVAKDSSVEKLINRLKEWYFEKEEDSVRDACGVTIHAINQRSPDVLKRHAALALPLAFLAMHQKSNQICDDESSEPTRSVWEEVWLDATPGSEAGVRLYLEELVAITKLALESQSWHMKAQGAAAMNTIATKLGANLGPPHLGMLLSALLTGLSGRTWTGKEALLKAVSSVCVSCKEAVAEDTHEPSLNKIVDAVIRECKKENMEYKIEGIKAVGPILETHNLDRFQEIYDILFPHLKQNDSNKKDEDEEISKDTRLEFQASAYQCLGEAWPTNRETQNKHQIAFCELLSFNQNKSVWKVEVAILKSFCKFFKRLCLLSDRNSVDANSNVLDSLIQQCIEPLCTSLVNIKYAAIRTEALALTELIISKLKEFGHLNVIPKDKQERLKSTLLQLSSDTHPNLQMKANDLHTMLQ